MCAVCDVIWKTVKSIKFRHVHLDEWYLSSYLSILLGICIPSHELLP